MLNASIQDSQQESQTMTPQDRLRRQLAEQFAETVAEFAVKVDKGSRHMTLNDLGCDGAKRLYIEEALKFLLGPGQKDRMAGVQREQAHQRATRENESETLMRDARADIAQFGGGRIQ